MKKILLVTITLLTFSMVQAQCVLNTPVSLESAILNCINIHLEWDDPSGGIHVVQYWTVDYPTNINSVLVHGNKINLKNLWSGYYYQWRVRKVCISQQALGQWSTTEGFVLPVH